MGNRAQSLGWEAAMKEIYGDIAIRIDGAVAMIEIDRPPHNHVNVALIRDLADVLSDIDTDRALRVSVLASAGKNFCAGADLTAPDRIGAGEGQGIGSLYEEAVRIFAWRRRRRGSPRISSSWGSIPASAFRTRCRASSACRKRR